MTSSWGHANNLLTFNLRGTSNRKCAHVSARLSCILFTLVFCSTNVYFSHNFIEKPDVHSLNPLDYMTGTAGAPFFSKLGTYFSNSDKMACITMFTIRWDKFSKWRKVSFNRNVHLDNSAQLRTGQKYILTCLYYAQLCEILAMTSTLVCCPVCCIKTRVRSIVSF